MLLVMGWGMLGKGVIYFFVLLICSIGYKVRFSGKKKFLGREMYILIGVGWFV